MTLCAKYRANYLTLKKIHIHLPHWAKANLLHAKSITFANFAYY